jgi:hypothetical protein
MGLEAMDGYCLYDFTGFCAMDAISCELFQGLGPLTHRAWGHRWPLSFRFRRVGPWVLIFVLKPWVSAVPYEFDIKSHPVRRIGSAAFLLDTMQDTGLRIARLVFGSNNAAKAGAARDSVQNIVSLD